MKAYLDYAAASPMSDRVRSELLAALEHVGSAGSVHDAGRAPAELLERSRARVADLIGARPEEIIFTSGATEARNLATKGLSRANRGLGSDVVISAVEHPATLAAARTATAERGVLTQVQVDADGRLDPAGLGAAITSETALVCLVHGQPDIGTVQDVARLVATARSGRPEVRVHVDAGDTAGRVAIDVGAMDCDALTIGAWPLGAPPWVGALYVREGARITPLIEGGVQEHGKRSGAEAVPAIAALGAAAELAAAHLDSRAARLSALGERLVDGLLGVEGVRLNGP
ncbi:MAG: aminotransferase class V-fold PLP-dependent enzyme, partial [Thermoleophilia bacterium]|nr:aminotransferase class V-fold PLP-dependent enzyme [Thermoleophilia bacterium]